MDNKSVNKGKRVETIVLAILILLLVFIFAKIMTANNETADKEKQEVVMDSSIVGEEENSDYVNMVGNSFSNLNYQCSFRINSHGYTGRVTSQGDNVYFYEAGFIYMMNSNGDKQAICSAQDASSLNVIGDTVYFLEGNKIYSVKTYEGIKEELLINVLAPFIVCDNCIYYVTSANVSATKSEYYISKYDIDENQPQESMSVGEYLPALIAINNEQNDSVIFYYEMEPYQHPEYNALYYDCYYLGSYNFDNGNIIGEEIMAPLNSCNSYFSAIPSNNYIYVGWYCDDDFGDTIFKLYCYDINNLELMTSKEDSEYFIPINSHMDNLIFKSASRLALVLSESIQDPNHMGIIEEYTILNEETQLSEVYVIGDYIYYTMSDYHNSNLYRIKIDGTCWEDI